MFTPDIFDGRGRRRARENRVLESGQSNFGLCIGGARTGLVYASHGLLPIFVAIRLGRDAVFVGQLNVDLPRVSFAVDDRARHVCPP